MHSGSAYVPGTPGSPGADHRGRLGAARGYNSAEFPWKPCWDAAILGRGRAAAARRSRLRPRSRLGSTYRPDPGAATAGLRMALLMIRNRPVVIGPVSVRLVQDFGRTDDPAEGPNELAAPAPPVPAAAVPMVPPTGMLCRLPHHRYRRRLRRRPWPHPPGAAAVARPAAATRKTGALWWRRP